MSHKGINKLLCAALVDTHFRFSLLEDPVQAYQAGLNGLYFDLSKAELDMLSGIKAENIEDFALQAHQWLEGQEEQKESIEVFYQSPNYLPVYNVESNRYANLPIPRRSR